MKFCLILFQLLRNYESYIPINLFAGSLAGATAVLFTYPLDLIRVQLAVAVRKKIYNGVFHALVEIPKKEGIRGLLKGISPTLWVNFTSI
jgi:solute carrier family 25 protein 16